MRRFQLKTFLKNYNFTLAVLVILLAVCGIFAVNSARSSLMQRQMLGVIAGSVVMIVVSLFDYHLYLKYYWAMYILNTVLLGLVLSPLGDDAGGSQRWLDLGIRFQPSEIAKILLILFFAQFIMIRREKLNTLRVLGTSVVLILVPLALIIEQPDLSTTIMIAVLFCVMIYTGGIYHRIIFALLAVFVPIVIIFVSIVLQPDQTLIKSYQQTRILAWLNPSEYADTQAYQQINSEMAIGSGQLLGKGYANNEISSVKNGNFISQPQTDFIFAVIGEEWGFIGCFTIIALLFLISLQCFLSARKAKDMAGRVICCGMGGLICFQSFINICVTTGLMPNTGIPLPLVSYGLTSLLTIFFGMGVVLNICLQSGFSERGNTPTMNLDF
ncbi:MAG: rod shape-determining protein RodA [Lachnospiraceae bacterium]|nr:rod shape-determining protein RodA [Lachnospiraceae bacterium]